MNHKVVNKTVTIVSLMMLFFYCTNVLALDTDKLKTAKFISDAFQNNNKTGISIFTGHVKMTQGSTQLLANKVIVHSNKNNKISRVIATGKRAEYNTLPKQGDKILVAKANTIDYYPQLGKVILIGDANVTQGNNSFSGPHIVYNVTQQVVISDARKGSRTTIFIKQDGSNTTS